MIVKKVKMNKVKILVDCSAYVSTGVLREFKKGELCKVNDFVFNSFTKSARAEAFKGEIENEDSKEKTKIKQPKENSQGELEKAKEEILKLKEIIEEQKENIEKLGETINSLEKDNPKKEDEGEETLIEKLSKMKKNELLDYAKEKYKISLSKMLGVKKIIKKIMEVQNG